MKVRSREINIVSMSALDMFCSALGAFMFLALLFFPFAPNLGPRSEEVAQLREDLREAEAERDAAKSRLEAQAVEVAIVIDTTMSMTGPIAGLKSQIRDFAHVVSRLAGDARIAIIEYKDNVRCPHLPSVRVLPLTAVNDAGLAQIQRFADSLEASVPCEQEGPEEDVAEAVRNAVQLEWSRTPPNRFIVVIGDNPPHNDAERTQVIGDARAWGGAGSRLSTLVPYASDISAASQQFYDELARSGNGTPIPPSDSFALSMLKAMTSQNPTGVR